MLSNRRYWTYLFLASLYSVLLAFRLKGAIFRLSPDASYDIFDDARNHPFSSIFSFSDGYLSILPRLMAHIIVIAPVEYTAIFSSSFTSLFWIFSGLTVYFCTNELVNSKRWSILAALMVVLVPSARESSLGNIGNVRWQLFIILAVAGSSPYFVAKFSKLLILIALITGLSHPLAVIAIIPIAFQFINSAEPMRKKLKGPLLAVGCTFLIQVGIHFRLGRGAIRGGITHWWANPPIFWLFNWIFPIALCLFIVVLFFATNRVSRNIASPTLTLAVTGFLIGLISWIQGGIADRYFVVPTVLGWIAFISLYKSSKQKFPFASALAFFPVALLLLIGSYKWFGPSSYINSGPTWSSEVERGRVECLKTGAATIELQMPVGTTEVPCSDLED